MTGYVADLSWKSGVRDWKVRSTKVDAGDFKHELLNRLRSTMAVNVLIKLKCNKISPSGLQPSANSLVQHDKHKHPHIQFTMNIILHTKHAGTFKSYLVEGKL